MIDFFQLLEFFEIEIQKLKEPLYNIYVYSAKTNRIHVNVNFPDTPNFDQNLIGGLTGTFFAFGQKGVMKNINSISLNHLKIIYASKYDLLFIIAGDPYFEDSAFYNSLNIFIDCFISNFESDYLEEQILQEEEIQSAVEMMFIFCRETLNISLMYESKDYELKIRERAKNQFAQKLTDIFQSHEKFFKQVAGP